MRIADDILNGESIQQFFDLSLDMLAIAGTDGYFRILNPAWEETLGYSMAELLRRPYLDFVHPDDREATIREASRLSEGKRTVSFENRYRCRDGTYKCLLWKSTLVPGSDRIVAIARDVSERKQHEEVLTAVNAALEEQVHEKDEDLSKTARALQESQDVLQRLASNLPGMAYRCRHDGSWTMIYVSNGVRDLTGYEPADMVGNRRVAYVDLIESDDRRSVDEAVAVALGRKTPFQMEYRIHTASGSEKWVWEQGQAVYREDGELLYLEGLILDVSERKKAEATIREQAALIDEARDAIIVRDLENRIVFWSRGAERVFGWARDEVLGKSAAEVLTDGSFSEFEAAMKKTIEEGYWNGELQMRDKSGKGIVVESRRSLLRDPEGQPRGALAIVTDITQRKRLEEQLLRAQRLESVGTLASGIAHDLNNALTPILMATQILCRKYGDRDARTLEMLESSAKRGARLVKQVLAFGRGMEGEPVVLQLRHVVKEFEKVTEQTFPKSIRLQVDVPKDLWLVSADPTQIEQVLMNLGVNARDAMPNGGILTIRARNVNLDATYARMQPDARPGPYVQLELADTGEGMPPGVLKRVFEPFYTTKEVGKGTGLGLSVLHSIVKNHGGFTDVYSEVGRGSTFKIYLPATEQEQKDASGPKTPGIAGNGETVLIVDDEAIVREMVSSVLEDSGYQVIGVTNGAEAVATYAKGGVDFVLLDWEMPVMNGHQAVEAIRNIDPQARIIASSGISHEAEIEMLDLPVPFLPKPYTAEDLLNGLAALNDARRGE